MGWLFDVLGISVDGFVSSIFNGIINWIYEVIFSVIKVVFTKINETGSDLFRLPWVQSLVNFFYILGWALFAIGLVVSISDMVIEYSNGKGDVKTTAINWLKAVLAVSLFTILPERLYNFAVYTQDSVSRSIIDQVTDENYYHHLVEFNVNFVNVIFILMILYATVKVFFANVKRGGILLTLIGVGSLYMLNLPRGYSDGFNGWIKQVIALCFTSFMQTTLFFTGLITIQSDWLIGTPSVLRFYPDYYICGNNYCSVWAIREYAPKTQEQAILSHIADHENVTLKIYNRPVSAAEQNQIIEHADRKNNAQKNTTTKLAEAIDAESNLSDMVEMLTDIRRNNESMVHTSVFIQLKSSSKERLTELQADISMELIRSKISYDRLLLQQKEGFIATLPFGRDMFGNLFERVMPISSAANLYPLNYSGKTDEKGLYIGKDKYGSSICVDFDVRSDDKTNSNIVILGNAGEGKSFLLKLILTNLRESGFDILNIDPNVEYVELTNNLGGVNIDLMGGKYTINPLEPTPWATDDNQTMLEVEAFSKTSALSQHISYLKDFFRCYKDFSDAAIDTLEIMLGKLYAKFNIFENTNLDKIPHNKFPLLTDLYAVIEEEYNKCEKGKKALYRSDTLQDLLLGLNSLCRGAESKYFNGHTNIKDGKMINFLIRGIMDTNAKLRDTILFNLLSYIQNRLLTKGRTFAGVDELHLFLNNLTTVKYLRAIMKQDRKMDSGLIIASQNVEDLTLPGIKEYTKPLLSIPTHQFFFYPGIVSSENFIDTLQLDPAEYKLINKPSRSHCLYRCGNERYLLKVIAPPYKAALFGTGGGR